MAQKEMHPPRVGQTWYDNDPRAGKAEVEITEVSETHVTLHRKKTGRTSKVKRERLRPIATGFVFVSEPDTAEDQGQATRTGASAKVAEMYSVDIHTVEDSAGGVHPVTVVDPAQDKNLSNAERVEAVKSGQRTDSEILQKLAAQDVTVMDDPAERDRALALRAGHEDLEPFEGDPNRNTHLWFTGFFYRWRKNRQGRLEAKRETDVKALRALHREAKSRRR